MKRLLPTLKTALGWRADPPQPSGRQVGNYRYYGQFDPPLDQVLHERYFPTDSRDGVFVECGAFDGVTESTCKFFEETLGWLGVNVEPSPPIFKKLAVNRPLAANVHAALSNVEGEATFTAVVHPRYGEMCTNGSLRHHPEHLREIRASGWKERPYTVRTTTWRRLVADRRLTRVDLFVLDVEGAELDVVAGMMGCPVLPGLICVEHGHLGVDRLRNAIEPLGYRYDGSREVNSFFVRATGTPSGMSAGAGSTDRPQ